MQSQFDEFVEDSKELEAELESQLEQAEKKISDLSKIKQSFELENDKLKVGYEPVNCTCSLILSLNYMDIFVGILLYNRYYRQI